MKRITLAMAMLAAFAMPAHAQPADRSSPNIVVIVADDHGADAIGAYGNRVVKTPAIDALARDGVRFDRAYATASSCSPSRATILTGKQTHTNGMYGLQQPVHHFAAFDDVDSLPLALSRMGYRTARIGKYHVAPESVFHFDIDLGAGKKAQRGQLGRSPVEMADLTTGFINQKSPFFLYFATNDPHRSAPHGGVNRFGNRDDGYAGAPPVVFSPKDVVVPPFLPDTPETRAELSQYYQSVARVDAGVARLIALLKAAGKYDDTVIVYLSDNGVAFPGAKTTLFEPGIRLPLIVKGPKGARAGEAERDLISWVDLMPTLLDYAGDAGAAKPAAGDYEGRSFKGLIQGEAYVPRSAVFASQTFHEIQMYYPMRVIRTDRFKLIWNLAYPLGVRQSVDLKNSATWIAAMRHPKAPFGRRPLSALLKRPEFELYDLKSDPNETRNLAEQRAYYPVLADLKRRLLAFMDESGDPWSPNWKGKEE